MKQFSLILVIVFTFLGFAQSQTTSINNLPSTVEEFVKMRNEIAVTPEGGATMFIVALKIYTKNPDVGSKCLVIATDRSRLTTGDVYKGFQLMKTDMNRIKLQMERYPYIPNSYFKGSTPKNGYKFNYPGKMTFSSNAYSGNKAEGNFKVFVKCYGADSPRPIKLVKNNKGFWKAKEWSSIIMGMRKPVVEVDDDL